MSIEIIQITWQNIPIEISYNNNWSDAYLNVYGYALAHIELCSENDVPLPMTPTGYRSHFISDPKIVDFGGAKKYVLDWLNHTAQSKKWKKYIAQSCQLTLDLF